MLASIILSLPGPIVAGLGFMLGRSSTQLADFVRRMAELAAVTVSFVAFRAAHAESAARRKVMPDRVAALCVGAAMCLGGAAMLLLAVLSRGGETGSVLPGLVIVILGVMTNAWFWLRYRALNRANPNPILAAQRNLYRAKCVVDACVMCTLAVIAAAPDSAAAFFIDTAGSLFVSAYLFVAGAAVLFGKRFGV